MLVLLVLLSSPHGKAGSAGNEIHIPSAEPGPEILLRTTWIEFLMKIHIPSADPGPEKFLRATECLMKIHIPNADLSRFRTKTLWEL